MSIKEFEKYISILIKNSNRKKLEITDEEMELAWKKVIRKLNFRERIRPKNFN